MKAITVSQNGEITINGTPVNSIEGLEFPYLYLNYEPDNGNMFKFTKNKEGDVVRVDLTSEEQSACKVLSNAFIPIIEPEPVVEATVEPVFGHKVSEDGRYEGHTELSAGDTQADSEPPKSDFLSEFGVVQRWDGTAWKIEGGYTAERLNRYLSEVGITDQVASLMNAVTALSNGDAVSAEFTDLVAKVNKIKSDIPKG